MSWMTTNGDFLRTRWQAVFTGELAGQIINTDKSSIHENGVFKFDELTGRLVLI